MIVKGRCEIHRLIKESRGPKDKTCLAWRWMDGGGPPHLGHQPLYSPQLLYSIVSALMGRAGGTDADGAGHGNLLVS